jgi:hypothetical protein
VPPDDDEDYVRGPGAMARRRAPVASYGPQPCPWADCPCTHTMGCVRGWQDSPDGASTRPCPVCRPVQAKIISDTALTRAQQQARLQRNKERR